MKKTTMTIPHDWSIEYGPDASALCSWGPTEWRDQDKLASNLDIVGYNYMDHETEVVAQ